MHWEMVMQALVFDGQVTLQEDYPRPAVAPGEALVAVRMAGVCRTDLEVVKGYMDFRGVMGHEFTGQVVEGPTEWVGKRVVSEINCVCGKCEMCRVGLSNHCRDRTVLGIDGHDGVFAEYVAVPARNLHHVPDSVSDVEAVMVEPLASAYQVVRQIKFESSDNVVILGDGRLAQLIVRVLKPLLPNCLLVGKYPRKLEAAEKDGVQTALVRDFRPSSQADVVIDATGHPSGFELALRAVRPRGTILLKSTFAAEKGLNLAPLVIKEVKVVGSRCGPFPDALRLLASREIDVSALISKRMPLRQGVEALSVAGRDGNLKVLIDVQ